MMLGLCAAISAAHGQIISTPDTLYRIAGGTSGTNDGTGSNAQFSVILGVTKNTDGNLYATDFANNTVRRITPAGVVSTFAGTAQQCGSADGTGTAASFCGPSGITADTAGNLYVVDSSNDTIRRITPAGVVRTLAGTAQQCGSADGTGSAASFCNPIGITADTAGNLYVTDSRNNTVRKITPAGVVSTLAGTAGPCGTATLFCDPYGITIDTAGNLYITAPSNHTIRRITPAGVVSTFAGTAQTCGSADGTGTAASFCIPTGITADTADNLYVADSNNNTIRKITPAQVVSTVAGTAGNSASGPYPAALPGTIHGPAGVAMFSANQLVIGTNFSELLGANFGEATIPFASFFPALALTTSPPPTKFTFGGTLALGASGSAFNPATDPVSLQFGAVSIAIPANSFQANSSGFAFKGVIGGVTVIAGIQPKGGGKYQLGIIGSGASLAGIANPVTVSLALGANVGSKAVTALIAPKPK
jgi:sugar lactone lactonase YvrE